MEGSAFVGGCAPIFIFSARVVLIHADASRPCSELLGVGPDFFAALIGFGRLEGGVVAGVRL
jgi:hypothetical protein